MSFLKEKPRIIPMVMRGCCCSIIPYQEIIGNYSIARKYRKRDLIIPYQEIIGNYSLVSVKVEKNKIIPYQEIIGNYSWYLNLNNTSSIIPYQEIIGNYSGQGVIVLIVKLYHTKK